jgi:hypothetical protein
VNKPGFEAAQTTVNVPLGDCGPITQVVTIALVPGGSDAGDGMDADAGTDEDDASDQDAAGDAP